MKDPLDNAIKYARMAVIFACISVGMSIISFLALVLKLILLLNTH